MGHLSRWMHSDIQVTLRRIGLAIAGMIFIFTIYDIFHHLQEEGQITIHSLMEGIFLLGMTVIILAIRNSADQEFSRAARELSQTRQELDRFRIQNHDLMHDYRKAVQEQFQRWGFTEGEQKVAEKLIQGYSFKEVAAQLEKKEKTVRNQSQALYDKAGMTGRHDLAAFFLQDILNLEEN
ncbi:MAG TPA: LuxR family transcriptional regulator [Leptospiraceae bacterium]|nr:LuxR family transcriptional regulator [Spirochaetaceae bacterium]HBS05415.1 LuxR family transcriptional regulator [Leptospiraceae bacterium]